jgi:hypothetical protein
MRAGTGSVRTASRTVLEVVFRTTIVYVTIWLRRAPAGPRFVIVSPGPAVGLPRVVKEPSGTRPTSWFGLGTPDVIAMPGMVVAVVAVKPAGTVAVTE